ncbi:hypothetical protein E4U31_000122 [Claviceps sp. LM219 group G6]|nr:hypothetical protein E4U31_000122 [Claviceps sp. LM219 group G6]
MISFRYLRDHKSQYYARDVLSSYAPTLRRLHDSVYPYIHGEELTNELRDDRVVAFAKTVMTKSHEAIQE